MKILAIALSIGLALLGLGQVAPVAQAPEPIKFDSPTFVEETELAREYRLEFPSPVETEWEANNRVYASILQPKVDHPVPVVVILHYWGARDLKVERSLANQLLARKIGVVLVTLPFHLQRTPVGTRSGELAVQADTVRLQSMMVQAVRDVRRTIDWCAEAPAFKGQPLGIVGISLGSIVSEVVAAVEPRINRAVFLLGGVDLAKIIWNSSRVVRQREAFRRQGLDEEQLREALVEVEPATYLSVHQPEKSFVIGATYDSVIPRDATDGLLRILKDRQKLWIDTGHYGGIFVQRRLMSEVATFFDHEFQGKTYTPPQSLRTPTVRVGAQYTSGFGLELGVGVDLVRSGRAGTPRISFVLTPRSPQILIVQQIDKAFGIGLAVRTRSSGIGVFWSTVL